MSPPNEFEPHELTGLFAPPGWLRNLGVSAWLAVGVTLFVAGVIAVLSLTDTIVMPVITAAVIAAVASPLVARFKRRGLGAALVLVGLIVLSIAVAGVVLGGISSQVDELRAELSAAKDTLADWATDAGLERDSAETAKEDISEALSDSANT